MTKGIVYKMYNTEKPEEVLIGSTSSSDLQTIRSKVLYEMKNKNGKRRISAKVHAFVATVPIEKWEIEELDSMEFKKRAELKRLEILYIRKLKPSLNKHHVTMRVPCQYCGKELNKRSLASHIKKTCPVRKQESLRDTNLYKGEPSPAPVPEPSVS